MTSRDSTGFLARRESKDARLLSEKLLVVGWGAIQWPWLLRSLHGASLHIISDSDASPIVASVRHP